MNNNFRLTETQVDSLLTDFRHRRDVADSNERYQEAATWGEAVSLLQDAQMAAFKARAAKPRKSLGLRFTR
jgi:hypothetical protein